LREAGKAVSSHRGGHPFGGSPAGPQSGPEMEQGLVVLLLLLDPCLQFRERVSIYSHGPSGMYALDEPDIALAASPVPVGAGDPDTPMRMPGLCVGQRIVFYLFSLQFPGSPRRAFSFRVRFLHPFDFFRSSGLWSITASGIPFLLPVPTMTGTRPSFQGFRGTPIDECPRIAKRCP
jgi:hypothetical protein